MTHPTQPQADAPPLTYSFEKTEPYSGLPRYTWALVGPDGGVHIWAQNGLTLVRVSDAALASGWRR